MWHRIQACRELSSGSGRMEILYCPHRSDSPLYLEWFSHGNGRVVMQSTRLAVERIGERAFELTMDQCVERSQQNSEEMSYFMHQLGEAVNETQQGDANSPDVENLQQSPLAAFAHEELAAQKFLRPCYLRGGYRLLKICMLPKCVFAGYRPRAL